MHLLSGEPGAEPVAESAAAAPHDTVSLSEIAALTASVSALQEEVASLKATVAKLCRELGVSG
jgi:uncharacterized protein YceH (UPF0502 family)